MDKSIFISHPWYFRYVPVLKIKTRYSIFSHLENKCWRGWHDIIELLLLFSICKKILYKRNSKCCWAALSVLISRTERADINNVWSRYGKNSLTIIVPWLSIDHTVTFIFLDQLKFFQHADLPFMNLWSFSVPLYFVSKTRHKSLNNFHSNGLLNCPVC